MAYTFEQVFAADPANPSNVAQNAAVTIFAPGDGTMTPLAITDPDGQPLANPLTVNANGFGSAFAHATLDRVAWAGGGFTGFFTSYEGMKGEAVAAREAAEAAAATAGTDAAAVATAAIGTATDASEAAAASAATAASNASASATAAANSAALVGAPADAAIAAAINGSATATKTALNATFVPKWKATTAYLAGEKVLSPSGDVVSAKVNFTSGASYDAANWNISTTYTGAAKTTTDGTEAQAQLGPKVRTKGAGANSVMVLQNNDPASGDNATRIYIVPKASVTSGVGGALKIFGDDYSTDQVNYRDFGLYFSQNQNGETGTRGDGCFYLNIKTNGTKAGLLPDLVFSMQDGTGIVGRASSPIVGGQSKYTFVVGPGKPEHAAKRALVLEVQGDMGFDGAADRSIYWETTGGVSSNKLAFERTASNGGLRLTLGGSQRAFFSGSGDLVLGDNSAAMAPASTVGFFHIRSVSGPPTGTPVTYPGAIAMVYCESDDKFYAYRAGAWRATAALV